ncbi:PilZ domain-containing protein [bacterium]|nr:PilZ domain-containing protein [bacterium]
MSSDRRQSPRLKYSLPLRYSRGGQRVYSGHALDVSATGAKLVLDEAASSPDRLVVELGFKVCLQARTVWAERLPSGQRMVGVVFEGVHSGQLQALNDYLSELSTRAA